MNTNPAKQWFDGKISQSKLCAEFNIPLADGSALLGAVWQALDEIHGNLRAALVQRIERAERDCNEASTRNDLDSMTAEAAMMGAYSTSLSQLQYHLGSAIENTGAKA